jgi:urease accessory protein
VYADAVRRNLFVTYTPAASFIPTRTLLLRHGGSPLPHEAKPSMRHRTEGPARSPLESAPLAPGRGVLAFARVEGETALVRRAARSPLQILSPRRCGRAAWAILSSHGGGLVAGDTLSLDVDVGPGATALLTTQSEGKVYRSTGGETAAQALRARIEGSGVLVALPDLVSCFAGARYEQRQRFELAPDASLLFVDGIACGREARRERWAFSRYASRSEVAVGGRLVFADSLELEANLSRPLAARLGRFSAFAMAVALGPLFARASAELLEANGRQLVPRHASLLAVASPIPGGFLLRAGATTPEELRELLRAQLAFTAEALGEDPFARRW